MRIFPFYYGKLIQGITPNSKFTTETKNSMIFKSIMIKISTRVIEGQYPGTKWYINLY